MSLVGSLEDLGLGDILQIVSLSRKSGLLLIHSEHGEGRIVFCDGLVRASYVKGEPDDLRTLLVAGDYLSEEEFDRAEELASARGVPVADVVAECTSLTSQSLDSLRREHVERAVFRIFSWTTGEFSFEVRDEIEPRDCEILISVGINAQYLTMEATRLGDESDREDHEESAAESAMHGAPAVDEGPLLFSGEEAADDAAHDPAALDAGGWEDSVDAAEPAIPIEALQVADPAAEPAIPIEAFQVAAPAAERASAEPAVGSAPGDFTSNERAAGVDSSAAEDVVALAAARRAVPEIETPARESAPVEPRARAKAASASAVAAASLIALDPNLDSLEWQKLNLAQSFRRVHIFQNGETGISRIRQYLRRGEIPVVLLAIDLATQPVSGVESLAEFIRRLKLLAPSMPVMVVRYEEARCEESIDAADAIVTGPDPALLANRKAWKNLREDAERFRCEVAVCLEQPNGRVDDSSGAAPSASASESGDSENLRTLRSVSERIRDPANQGDVIRLVLHFVAQSFSRVALFMVRDEVALGIAQIGLPRGGGPGDDTFREIEVSVAQVGWFRQVLESRTSLHSAATNEGDRDLARRLGAREPAEAYIAPIVSGGRVVTLLYVHNLPGSEPIGDTSIIEIALHEAGVALERALLQRALAQIGGPSAH